MVVGLVTYAALGSLVGVAVGAVEILQRYRDASFRAVFNGWGIGYVVLCGATIRMRIVVANETQGDVGRLVVQGASDEQSQ